jgi:dimethylamine monooxygenase subunit A
MSRAVRDNDTNNQPFHNGPPVFDVGLRPITLDKWLIPDDQAIWLPEKRALIDTKPKDVFAADNASHPAQIEVATLIGALFERTCNPQPEPPLLAASRLVSDDLVIMEPAAGAWTTTACCLCSPTFFDAHYALGKSLEMLHGPVPDGDFGLAARIGRVFSALAPDVILERHNWTVQWSDARYTPNGTPLRAAAQAADVCEARDALTLRVERQTIRKLPMSGAVLFTIRIRLTRLIDAIAHDHDRQAFATAWEQATMAVRTYKKWAVLERHVAHVLDHA